jgi:hypothetical protein
VSGRDHRIGFAGLDQTHCRCNRRVALAQRILGPLVHPYDLGGVGNLNAAISNPLSRQKRSQNALITHQNDLVLRALKREDGPVHRNRGTEIASHCV